MPRPKSNRLGMYADIQEILDAALAHSGGSVECPSNSAALKWRHRAHAFRKLYAELLGPSKLSKYDRLTFPNIPSNSSTVIIKMIGDQNIKFTPNVPEPQPISDEDEISLAAAAIAKAIDEGEL